MNNDTPSIQDLRLYVDGELSPERVVELEQRLEQDAELRRQIEFEKQLRKHVGTILLEQSTPAPAGLAAEIHKALANAEDTTTDASPVAGSIAPAPRRTIFTGPTKANVFAVAASLAIVAGAILFGIFGPNIDRHQQLASTDTISDAAAFASGEHTRCASSEDALSRKLVYQQLDSARAALANHLGVEAIPRFDLTSLGYIFAGGGPCGVPGSSVSGHLMFQRETPTSQGYPLVSIFMVPQDELFKDGFPFDADRNVWAELNGGPASIHRVLLSGSGEMAFFVCCCMDDDLDSVAKQLGFQMRLP